MWWHAAAGRVALCLAAVPDDSRSETLFDQCSCLPGLASFPCRPGAGVPHGCHPAVRPGPCLRGGTDHVCSLLLARDSCGTARAGACASCPAFCTRVLATPNCWGLPAATAVAASSSTEMHLLAPAPPQPRDHVRADQLLGAARRRLRRLPRPQRRGVRDDRALRPQPVVPGAPRRCPCPSSMHRADACPRLGISLPCLLALSTGGLPCPCWLSKRCSCEPVLPACRTACP